MEICGGIGQGVMTKTISAQLFASYGQDQRRHGTEAIMMMSSYRKKWMGIPELAASVKTLDRAYVPNQKVHKTFKRDRQTGSLKIAMLMLIAFIFAMNVDT